MADETEKTQQEKPKRTRKKAEPAVTAETPAETPAAEAEPEETVAEAEPEPEGVDAAAEAEAPAAEAAPAAAPAQAKAPAGPKRSKRAETAAKAKPKREKPAARKPIVRLEKPVHDRGRRQELRGIVVSSAMDKTIVVKAEAIKAHPRYKKVVRHSVKFHAHDEANEANVGDVVRIVETRPLSKTKCWRLAEVVEVAR